MELIGRSEIEIGASPAAVWATLIDVAAWKTWMPGVRWAVLEGEFAAGAYVTIRPLHGRQTAYRVVVTGDATGFGLGLTFGPVASISRTWTLALTARGTRVTYNVETGGPLARWIVAASAARAHAEGPALLAALARAVSSRRGPSPPSSAR